MIAFELRKIYSQFTGLFLLISFIFSFGAAMSQSKKTYILPSGISKDDYSKEFLIVKFESTANQVYLTNEIKKAIKSKKLDKAITLGKPSSSAGKDYRSKAATQIENIIKIELSSGEDVIEAINSILQIEGIAYAEPYYLIKPLTAPDDPAANPINGAQSYLKQIKAYEAWEMEKGNPNVIIGILDTGVDYEHVDLKGNHYKNSYDPIDKFDNDNDGYIDNHIGWDFGNSDNDPIADKSFHGTQVAGIAAATPNNGIGIAGVGYNSSYMPIKIFRTQDNMFNGGYEAIVYAAEKGCKVINLSWGSANAYSRYAQDLINYAVLELDAVVVAAAGNTPQELDFYPASYDNVLSVGAIDANDVKASWATYSKHIDIMAPGNAIYTTNNGNQYYSDNGTSFAAPMVAGAAALVRSKFPHLTAVQVMERLRMSTDDIYHLPGNAPFQGLLGRGRLNVAKALTQTDLSSIRLQSFKFSNKFGTYAFFDDSVRITTSFKNLLSDTESIKITLSSESPYVTVINSVFEFPSIRSGEVKSNELSPFSIYLNKFLPPDHKLVFKLIIEGKNFKDVQYFNFNTSPAFLTLGNANLNFTVASDGNLGINNDYSYLGNGLTYNNQRILEQVGFMVSTGPDKVMNNVITDFVYGSRNKDFVSTENIKFYDDSEADLDARSTFQPVNNGHSVGLNIEQKILKWEGTGPQNYFIIEYRISNISGNDLSEIRTGVFANWDLNDKKSNRADWDDANKLGYVYDGINQNLFSGMALISDHDASYYAIDQKNHNGNTPSFGEDFSRTSKYVALSSGKEFSKAGKNGTGNDVSHNVGANLGSLKKGESVKLAFALTAGSSLNELQNNISYAKSQYLNYVDNPPVLSLLKLCPGASVILDPVGENFEFFSDSKMTNLIHKGTTYTLENPSENQNIFVVNLDKGFKSDVRQIKVRIDEAVADFSMNTDVLTIQEGSSNVIYFKDLSLDATSWKWTFGNGYESSVKNPKIRFSEPGEYMIRLYMENETGCSGSISKKLVVVKNPSKPVISDLIVCSNESAVIQASNSNHIRVYSDQNLATLLYEGPLFVTEALLQDALFYITNIEDNKESLPTIVKVALQTNRADFKYQLNPEHTLAFENTSIGAISQVWYINDAFVSNEKNFHYPIYDLNEMKLKLITWNESNCADSIMRIISIEQSEQPVDFTNQVCAGETIVLRPGNGSVYNFYEDETLKNLVHSGSSFETLISKSKKFYITNFDALIESKPATATITAETTNASFISDKDTVYLSEENTVFFKSNSTNATEYLWKINNQMFASEADASYKFLNSGTFSITLTAKSSMGCTDTVTRNVVVMDERFYSDPFVYSSLNLFPNPTEGRIKVSLTPDPKEKALLKVNIYNSSGLLLLSNDYSKDTSGFDLDLSPFPKGIYNLQIQSSEGIANRKIILNK